MGLLTDYFYNPGSALVRRLRENCKYYLPDVFGRLETQYLDDLSDTNLIAFRDFCRKHLLDDLITWEVVSTLNQHRIQKIFTTKIREYFMEQQNIILLDNAGTAAGNITIDIKSVFELEIKIHGEFPDHIDPSNSTSGRSHYRVEYVEKHRFHLNTGQLQISVRYKAIDHKKKQIYVTDNMNGELTLVKSREAYQAPNYSSPHGSPIKKLLEDIPSAQANRHHQQGTAEEAASTTAVDVARIGWKVRALDDKGDVTEEIQIGQEAEAALEQRTPAQQTLPRGSLSRRSLFVEEGGGDTDDDDALNSVGHGTKLPFS